jgi:diguanylate cyclase (GGDEF)-like protein
MRFRSVGLSKRHHLLLMQSHPRGKWKDAFTFRSLRVREGVLLLVVMTIATCIAYEYQVFPEASGISPQKHIIELDEALVLSVLLCVGLLVITSRALLSQRREVARRIEAEHRARMLALQDPLTALPNRRRFDQELKTALGALPRSNGADAVFLLDLTGFKRVNDVYGHGVGDEVLINFASRVQRAVRAGDLVARLGGDEFAVLALQLAGAEEATSIGLRIIKELDQPITSGSTRHQITVGIGIALIPQDGRDEADILRKADIALYRAKSQSRSALCFFEANMDAHIRDRRQMEVELHVALSQGTVLPYYQPLIELKTNRIISFEALARWTHPIFGEVPPDRFIAIAEECGLINELTDHLLQEAARTACNWPDEVTLSFNISASQLKDQTIAARTLSIIKESGLSPHRLEIELTESAIVQDLENAKATVRILREAGVRIVLDDFGTGYSSFYHLLNFKIDKIKIDRSFIRDMESNLETAALVRALLGFGHGLGLTMVAEGVELPGQATDLLEQGCEQVQGYLYARAMPAFETIKFLRSRLYSSGKVSPYEAESTPLSGHSP